VLTVIVYEGQDITVSTEVVVIVLVLVLVLFLKKNGEDLLTH
jgi:hypothetical protein